jgi:hypothetical protein
MNMKARSMLLIALMLSALPHIACAQSVTPRTDPISGTWTGDLGPEPAQRMRVSIELKFDGTTFSGLLTTPGLAPGDITGGTFNARTRAVNFTVAVRGGDTKVQFAGTLDRDTISGNVTSASVSGTFRIARGAAGATPPRAAEPSNAAVRANVRAAFVKVNDLISAAMVAVPTDKFSYRPTATARTFAELVAHVADSYQYYCGRAVRPDLARSDAIEKGPTDRLTLTRKLRFAIDTCNGAHEDGDLAYLIENVAYANQNYGAIVMYMRMLGLTPAGS